MSNGPWQGICSWGLPQYLGIATSPRMQGCPRPIRLHVEHPAPLHSVTKPGLSLNADRVKKSRNSRPWPIPPLHNLTVPQTQIPPHADFLLFPVLVHSSCIVVFMRTREKDVSRVKCRDENWGGGLNDLWAQGLSLPAHQRPVKVQIDVLCSLPSTCRPYYCPDQDVDGWPSVDQSGWWVEIRVALSLDGSSLAACSFEPAQVGQRWDWAFCWPHSAWTACRVVPGI